jgi:hypothetical protein
VALDLWIPSVEQGKWIVRMKMTKIYAAKIKLKGVAKTFHAGSTKLQDFRTVCQNNS